VVPHFQSGLFDRWGLLLLLLLPLLLLLLLTCSRQLWLWRCSCNLHTWLRCCPFKAQLLTPALPPRPRSLTNVTFDKADKTRILEMFSQQGEKVGETPPPLPSCTGTPSLPLSPLHAHEVHRNAARAH
jgi:hypothetical protein